MKLYLGGAIPRRKSHARASYEINERVRQHDASFLGKSMALALTKLVVADTLGQATYFIGSKLIEFCKRSIYCLTLVCNDIRDHVVSPRAYVWSTELLLSQATP